MTTEMKRTELSGCVSDARHYAPLCDHVYCFSPTLMTSEDMNRVHGTNKRIGIEDLARMVKFYGQLIQTW